MSDKGNSDILTCRTLFYHHIFYTTHLYEQVIAVIHIWRTILPNFIRIQCKRREP